MILKKEIVKKETGYILETDSIKKIETYIQLLLENNKLYNLTRIVDNDGILYKHIIDSIYFIKNISSNSIDSLIDIGTGGGIPGIIFAIISGKNTYLLESIGKKCQFLDKVKKELVLSNLTIINERVEEYGKKNREKFSMAVSRAFSATSYCMETHFPLVKIGGQIVLMDGPSFELTDNLTEVSQKLGGVFNKVIDYNIGKYGNHKLIFFDKLKKTDIRFPRTNAAMKKRPLF